MGDLDTGSERALVGEALRAVARGDLSARLPASLGELADAFNSNEERVAAVASEVTRVATELGTEGKLGGRAVVPGAQGAWASLCAATNELAGQLTAEVRGLAESTTAVARGELDKSLDVPAGGEIMALNRNINIMIEQLRALAGEATRVAREVGVDRKSRPQPRLAGVSGIWKELTDNLSLAEQLALVSRSKSELIASVSHELRTPLNSLLLLAKLLSDNREANLTATQVEYARTIYGSGGDLLSLINDLLDLAKVDAGKMTVELGDLELDDLIDALERTFRPLAAQNGLALLVEVEPEVPRRLRGDGQRQRQVLINLVSNALKFTDAGGVTLRIARAGSSISFAVTDTGIGIAPENLELIFEPFQQAHGSARRFGGTGLGLSISRALAELLGGELRVESTPGHGSTFTLAVPFAPAASASQVVAARPSPRRPVPTDPVLTGRKILVIDDDIRHVFALASLLEPHGAELVFAERSGEGHELLREHPDVSLVLVADRPEEAPPELGGARVLAVPKRLDPDELLHLIARSLAS